MLGRFPAPAQAFVELTGHFRALGPLQVYELDAEMSTDDMAAPQGTPKGRPAVNREELDNTTNRLLLFAFSRFLFDCNSSLTFFACRGQRLVLAISRKTLRKNNVSGAAPNLVLSLLQ